MKENLTVSTECQCPRRILRIRWQQRMTNKRVVEMAEINDISCEVRRRRWSWLGHVLRREDVNDCFTALGWTPEGRRARGRPKTTWRRTAEKREKHGQVEELECGQGGGWQQRMLGGQCDGLMRLLAQRDMMMIMMMMMSNKIMAVELPEQVKIGLSKLILQKF